MSESSGRVSVEIKSAKSAKIAVFGTLRLETEDSVVEAFGSRHAATILAILALHPEPVSRARLSAELWPGEDEEVVRPRLRQELFRLKKALGEWAPIVHADREMLSLRRAHVSTDVEEFLSLVQAGRSVEGERRIELWQAAAELYKDDILVDYNGDWLDQERAALQGVRRRLLLNLTQQLIDRGRAADAVEHARALVRQDGGDESAHAALAQALFCSGDAPSAREQLRKAETRLRAEGRNRGEALARAWRMLEAAPADVPAPTRTRALPAALYPMFGREAELEKILAMVEGDQAEAPRLLTIVGFGGMGKTRLAIEVAQRIAAAGKRHTGFVSLIEVDDVDVMVQNILGVVSQSRPPTQDSYSLLSAELDGKDITLVLDNFEELIPQATSTVERLLNENPGLRLLVTSRTPLGILGEQTFPLAPLPMPIAGDPETDLLASPSVALFLDHTLRVRPEFEVNEETLASVVKLVRAVEGIPLAILLTACRMRTISPQEAERAIQDRLAFLSGPKGGFETRHRTMRACIEWTSDALPPAVQAFWKKLAIFHGGWTLAAAEKVLEEKQALDFLEILCDSSLVQRDQVSGQTRYAMFEPVRQLADELLSAADRETASGNLAKYCVAHVEEVARQWSSTSVSRRFTDIEAEMDNIRAALSWSLANNHSYAQRLGMVLRVFWADSGWHGEGRQWIDKILALPEASWLPRERMLTMLSAGIMCMDQADFWQARNLYLGAKKICDQTNDRSGMGWISLNLAHLDILRGFVSKAVPLQRQALDAFVETGGRTGIAHASSDLGQSLVRMGWRDDGLDLLRRALNLRTEIGWENGIAFAHGALGAALLKVGLAAESHDHLMAAHQISVRTKDARILLDVLSDISECCLVLGLHAECADMIRDLRDLCRKVGDQLGSVTCDVRSGAYELSKGGLSASIEYAQRALESAIRLEVPIAILEAVRLFAAIALAAGLKEACDGLARGVIQVGAQLEVASWPTRDAQLEALIANSGMVEVSTPKDIETLVALAGSVRV